MASKRSKVDGVITVCAASDILAQDLDDGEAQVEPEAELQKPRAKDNGDPVPEGFVAKVMEADGLCKECDNVISKGKPAAYDPKRGLFHPDCVPAGCKA